MSKRRAGILAPGSAASSNVSKATYTTKAGKSADPFGITSDGID
jgi:hypothetical protein